MRIGGDRIDWNWRGAAIALGVTRIGNGPVVLMLPALSSISTRGEMRPLGALLATEFTVMAIDWPGFGDAPRPAMTWEPNDYRAFLAALLETLGAPFATIAAGHAAGYCIAAARARPGSAGRLALVAPTWRGPLPTVFGKRHPAFGRIARAGDLPVIGQALYRLNVNPFVVKMMALGHVYVNAAALPPGLLEEKFALTRLAGARHGSIRFVTGELDPMTSHSEFVDAAAAVADPILVVYGAQTPKKSQAEMAALAALPRVRSVVLPAGKLGVHEEFAAETAAALRPFLKES